MINLKCKHIFIPTYCDIRYLQKTSTNNKSWLKHKSDVLNHTKEFILISNKRICKITWIWLFQTKQNKAKTKQKIG